MENIDAQYRDLFFEVWRDGTAQDSRAGATRSVFAPSARIHFRASREDHAPLITTKPVNIAAIGKELAWFIGGRTNTRDLGCKIWDAWAQPDGACGPIYGAQWRGLGSCDVDQLRDAIVEAVQPGTRRAVVSAWNPTDLPDMALAPCHTMFQLANVDGKLHLQLYQRSADLALGVPFNILSYWILQTLIARTLKLRVGTLTIVYGDLHVYVPHFGALLQQVQREPHYGNVYLDTAPAQTAFEAVLRNPRDNAAYLELHARLAALEARNCDDAPYMCAHPAIKYAVAV